MDPSRESKKESSAPAQQEFLIDQIDPTGLTHE